LRHSDRKPWSPCIARLAVDPAAWLVDLIGGQLRDGLLLQRRRRRQQLHLGPLRIDPVPGHPLPTAGNLLPAAGQPEFVRRRHPPAAADPDMLVLLLVPLPVAGNPPYPLSGWLLIRGQLLDGSR